MQSFVLNFVVVNPYNFMYQYKQNLLEMILNIPGKRPPASIIIIFGIPNGPKNFPKDHHDNFYYIISFSSLYYTTINPFIQSINVRFFGIHPDLEYLPIYRIPGILHYMEYQNQLYESDYVPHYITNQPIGNIFRLLLMYKPPYSSFYTKTIPLS